MSSTRRIRITARWLSVAVAVLATVAFATSAAEVELLAKRPEQDVFVQLAKSLTVSGDIQRQDFAWIAVSEVTRAYEKALEDSASAIPTEEKTRYKLARWRQATREFIIQQQTLLAALSTSAEVQVHTGAAGLVVVLVNNDPIVISGPALNASRLMERRIIEAYCGLHDCDGLSVTSSEPTGDSQRYGNGTWVLKQRRGARYETPDGLVFLFSSLSGRTEKQRICENIAKELRVLVADLRDAKQAGFVVDWNSLEVHPIAGSDLSSVALNQEGDYLRQNLPYLEMTRLLRKGALAWARKMVEGQEYASVVINADRLMDPDNLETL